jgi:hypothetical protein
VRWSLHPTMTNEEVETMISALTEIVANIESYKNDYMHVQWSNVFRHKKQDMEAGFMKDWFSI